MNPSIEALQNRIRLLEDQIESEVQRRRESLHADFENTRIRFEREVIAAQKRFKAGLLSYVWHSSLLTILTAPIIYAGIVPLLLMDLFVTVYQAVCFPVYGALSIASR